MQIVHLLISVVFVIIFCSPVYSNTTEQFNYESMSSLSFCLNKSHILYKPHYPGPLLMTNETISAILEPLNNFRKNLRRFQFICNLPDLKWNFELAKIARETLVRDHKNYCFITRTFKNIIYFSQEFSSASNNEIIQRFIESSTNQINPNPFAQNLTRPWMFSAYSTEIGCAQTQAKLLHCMVNGIELKYFDQSYGYDDECNITESVIGHKTCVNSDTSTNCTNHYLCNIDGLPSGISLPMDFTTVKFILNKFDTETIRGAVVWDIDLAYFAKRIIAHNLDENDKCLAQKQYPEMSALHFNGVPYFDELMSNIDSVWVSQNVVHRRIGCVAFNTVKDNNTLYFNLYCLTGNGPVPLEPNFIESFLKYFRFNRSDFWLIYLLLILTYLNIIAVIIVCRHLNHFERKRLLSAYYD